MMTGRITPEGEATIALDLLEAEGQVVRAEAVIDTGFNGHVTAPAAIIRRLGLPLAGNRRATLGDGTVVVLDVYLASVVWHDGPREVLVLQTEGGTLAGMALFWGSRLTLEVTDGGSVTLEALS